MKQNMTNYRWRVVGLLFFATTLNYLDRQVLSILKPFISEDLGWSEVDYGYIVTAFQIAYGLGLLLTSAFLDKLGTKKGYGIAVGLWSIACAAHAFVRSVFGFGVSRVFLGLGESANFPAAVKSVSEWFPKKERALATGIFNSGSSVGAILAPLIIAFVTMRFGWRMAFIVTGSLGGLWLILWWLSYKLPQQHSKLSKQELSHILSDNESERQVKISWFKLLTNRNALAICIVKTMTDWVWWFLLFWAPDFLEKLFSIDLNGLTRALAIIYAVASIGGISGGWLSSKFIKSGRSIDFSRKIVMLICGVIMLSTIILPFSGSLWVAVLLLSIATAAHQGWSSNVFTLASDIFPKNKVGSIVSMAGFVAAIGGALSAALIGFILEYSESYKIVFAVAGSMYIISWLLLRIMVPEIKPENF